MGGTCDSVGVGGCWLGGCYGPFTKLFGNGAINLLEANVVLANGTLVTCSESQHPDLFWTLRGGGGGNTGVRMNLKTGSLDLAIRSTVFWHKAPLSLFGAGSDTVHCANAPGTTVYH